MRFESRCSKSTKIEHIVLVTCSKDAVSEVIGMKEKGAGGIVSVTSDATYNTFSDMILVVKSTILAVMLVNFFSHIPVLSPLFSQ